MNDFKVNIPKPCHEDWNRMAPKNNGRHCASCDKIVVDFTTMTADQIKEYFIGTRGQRICGHFKTTQTKISQPFLHKQLNSFYDYIETKWTVPLIKMSSLLLIGFFMTLVGCQNRTTGERNPSVNSTQSINGEENLLKDSVCSKDSSITTTGEILVPLEIDSTNELKK